MPKFTITYFKDTGKFCTSEEFEVAVENMFEVADYLRERVQEGHELPGLASKEWEGPILLTSDTAKYAYPWLMPHGLRKDPNRLTIAEAHHLRGIVNAVHQAHLRWWHTENGNRIERNKGELLCLIHSEISEAMEGERKNLMDDHLPLRRMAEVELADAVIRIFDYAAGHGYDLAGALVEKVLYNQQRQDHTYAARKAEGGKKF